MKRALLLLCVCLGPVNAQMQSFTRIDYACPLCGNLTSDTDGEEVSDLVERPRDLYDKQKLSTDLPLICPRDLYSSLGGRWQKVSPEEKQALAAFLKQPAVTLTPAEKKITEGHLDELKHTGAWDLLWLRSCESLRKPDLRANWQLAMRMHYWREEATQSGEAWQTKLADEFRREAIQALKDGVAAGAFVGSEKRWLPYLEGELLRQVGRHAEAKVLFQQVIESESKEAPDAELEWILTWAREQSARVDAAKATVGELAARVLPHLPVEAMNKTEGETGKWNKHQAALEELKARALAKKDAKADEALWKIVGKDPARLGRMVHAIPEFKHSLRLLGKRWRELFDTAPEGAIPQELADPSTDPWLEESVWPAVLAAGKEGGPPEINAESQELMDSLYQLSRHPVPPGSKLDAAGKEKLLVRMMIRVMKSMKTNDIDNGMILCTSFLANSKAAGPGLKPELAGDWRSPFVKAIAEVAALSPGALENLATLPGYGDAGHPGLRALMENLVFQILTDRKSPLWKEKSAERIKSPENLPYFLCTYVATLGDSGFEELLLKRAEERRKVSPPGFVEGQATAASEEILGLDYTPALMRLRRVPVRKE